MGLNDTPSSERVHISFFGCRNAGKSSLLNSVTGQQMAIVSDVKGTTTDPVSKAMELLPAGPVVVTDTPGLDDVGKLGKQRIDKALLVLRKTDVAILVVDASQGFRIEDMKILEQIRIRHIPYIVVFNKYDLVEGDMETIRRELAGSNIPKDAITFTSTVTSEGIDALKERIAVLAKGESGSNPLVGDLIESGDMVVLVVPIDKAAPKGRIILPQQQTIRDLLDHGGIPVVTRDSELALTLKKLENRVKLVITDSQVFKKVNEIVPAEIPLTSFSILMSRYRGDLAQQLKDVQALDHLEMGDKILIAEGCTHHRQCGDIGTVKLPNMLKKYTGKNLELAFVSGQEFPEDLKEYKMVLHCGGCMLNEKEMKARLAIAAGQGVPITNYGMAIAKMTGILERSIAPLENAKSN